MKHSMPPRLHEKVCENVHAIIRDFEQTEEKRIRISAEDRFCIQQLFWTVQEIPSYVTHFLENDFHALPLEKASQSDCFTKTVLTYLHDYSFYRPFISRIRGMHVDIGCWTPVNAMWYHTNLSQITQPLSQDNTPPLVTTKNDGTWLTTVGINKYARIIPEDKKSYADEWFFFMTQDALAVLYMIPPKSVDVISLNGIDSHIIEDLAYCSQLLDRMIAVLKPWGIIIDLASNLETFSPLGNRDERIQETLIRHSSFHPDTEPFVLPGTRIRSTRRASDLRIWEKKYTSDDNEQDYT